jgi:hypothetical protein
MSTLYERYKERIENIETALNLLYEEYINAIPSLKTKSYSFNSGHGSQSATNRDPSEIFDIIQKQENHLDWLYRKAGQGGGLVNLNLRRIVHDYKINGD